MEKNPLKCLIILASAIVGLLLGNIQHLRRGLSERSHSRKNRFFDLSDKKRAAADFIRHKNRGQSTRQTGRGGSEKKDMFLARRKVHNIS